MAAAGRTRQVLGKEQKGLKGTFGVQHTHGYSFIVELTSALTNISMTLKHLHQLTFLQFIFKLLNKMLFFFFSDRMPFVCLFVLSGIAFISSFPRAERPSAC